MSKFSQRLDMQMDVSSQGILQLQPLKLDFLDALSPRPNVDPLTDLCNHTIPLLDRGSIWFVLALLKFMSHQIFRHMYEILNID